MNNMKRNDGSGSKVREKRRCRLLPIGIQRKLFVITAMVAAFVTMMAGTIHTDYREINAGNCAELDNVTAVTLSDPGLTFEGWQLYSSDGTLLETVAPGGRFSAAKFAGRGEVFTVRYDPCYSIDDIVSDENNVPGVTGLPEGLDGSFSMKVDYDTLKTNDGYNTGMSRRKSLTAWFPSTEARKPIYMLKAILPAVGRGKALMPPFRSEQATSSSAGAMTRTSVMTRQPKTRLPSANTAAKTARSVPICARAIPGFISADAPYRTTTASARRFMRSGNHCTPIHSYMT